MKRALYQPTGGLLEFFGLKTEPIEVEIVEPANNGMVKVRFPVPGPDTIIGIMAKSKGVTITQREVRLVHESTLTTIDAEA